MKIVSWNVNSIRARHEQVLEWVKDKSPDVILIQETKCLADQFPREEFEDLGYNIELLGQKTFNGVAILSKFPVEDIQYGIPGYEDAQARFIQAVIKGIHFICVYVPNGQEPGSEKYQYKLQFLDHFIKHIQSLRDADIPFLLGGDFNIALKPADVYDPHQLNDSICFTMRERQELNHLINLGITDVQDYLGHKNFTWWDYRGGSFEKNKGMRIDYIFVSPHLVRLLKSIEVDTMARDKDKASDHAPLVCELS